jgi:hypothetical protein
VEEPELPEHHRGGQQAGGDEAEGRGDERQEGEKPHEVLGRDELRERQKCGYGRRGSGHDPLAVDPTAGDQPNDEQDGRHLQPRGYDGESVRQRAREIPRDGGGRAADDLRVVDPDAVRDEQHGAGEALELERPLRLRLEALPEAIPTQQRERSECGDHDRPEGEQGTREAAWTHRQAEERHQRDRVELRGHGQPEQREGERRPLVEQRADGARHEQRRPDVVGVERDGPKRQGSESEGEERPVQPPQPGA